MDHFLEELPGLPMRLAGLGTNLASFLDLRLFSDLLEAEGAAVGILASKLRETFDCIAATMDGSKGTTGFSILG